MCCAVPALIPAPPGACTAGPSWASNAGPAQFAQLLPRVPYELLGKRGHRDVVRDADADAIRLRSLR